MDESIADTNEKWLFGGDSNASVTAILLGITRGLTEVRTASDVVVKIIRGRSSPQNYPASSV